MVRIFLLFIISVFCTTAAIYADCDLPTGGACKIEDLRREQENFSKILNREDYLNQLDENYQLKQELRLNHDLQNELDLEHSNKLKID